MLEIKKITLNLSGTTLSFRYGQDDGATATE